MTTDTTAPRTTPEARGAIPPGVEYHRVLAGDRRRIGRGILAIALLIGGMFGSTSLLYLVGAWLEELLLGSPPTSLTPITFGSSLVAAALVIPWSMLIQRVLYGVRPASLHSVASRFRFGILGRAALGITPLFVVALSITELLDPGATTAWAQADVVGMLLVILLLVPLQAAGEEYGFRGLVLRVAGGWVHGRLASLVLGTVVSTAAFSVIHLASDPWWNVFYVLFSVVASIVTWRTGGVEVAAVLHAAYNVVTIALWVALHADLDDRFDRSAGAVTPALLVPTAIALIVIAVAVLWRTRGSGPALTPEGPRALP